MSPVDGTGQTWPRGREVHAGLDAWGLLPASEAAMLGVIREYEMSADPDAAADAARAQLAALRPR